MKLIYQIILRVSVALVILLTAWAAFFYFALQTEINDEVDDAFRYDYYAGTGRREDTFIR